MVLIDYRYVKSTVGSGLRAIAWVIAWFVFWNFDADCLWFAIAELIIFYLIGAVFDYFDIQREKQRLKEIYEKDTKKHGDD